MRNIKIVLLFAVLVGAALSGCKKSDLAYKSDFEKSYDRWTTFKANSNNSYSYTVAGGSWVGIGWETTLTIENGIVVKREFTYNLPTDWEDWQPPMPEGKKHWEETGTELGSHSDTPAAAPLTLEEVYAKAKNDWLKKRKDVTTYFEAGNNGMISSAGYIPDGCQDDCFVGITITSIEKLDENSEG